MASLHTSAGSRAMQRRNWSFTADNYTEKGIIFLLPLLKAHVVFRPIIWTLGFGHARPSHFDPSLAGRTFLTSFRSFTDLRPSTHQKSERDNKKMYHAFAHG